MMSNRARVFLRSARGVSDASAKELVRSGLTVTIILVSFVLMLGIFVVIDAMFSTGSSHPSSLRSSLGVVAAMGMASIAFTGTSVMLVNYRERGTMRILGSTPLSRIAFLCGQMPVRCVIALAEFFVIAVVMAILGARDPMQYFSVAVSSVCGFLMFMALGVLLGARGNNADIAMQFSLVVPLIIIFTSGVAVPLDGLPHWVNVIIDFLPTTWFMDAVNSWALGEGALNTTLAWACMVGVALVATAAASYLFDWGHAK